MAPEPPTATLPVVVRPSRPNDSSKLSAFIVEAWGQSGPDSLGFAGAKDESVSEISSQDFLKRRLSSPVLLFVIAEEGPRVVGMATSRKTASRDCEVIALSVLKGRSGTGLESRLLRKTLDIARKRGFVTLTAKVRAPDERAAAFYKAAGFTESGKEAGPRRGPALRILEKRLR